MVDAVELKYVWLLIQFVVNYFSSLTFWSFAIFNFLDTVAYIWGRYASYWSYVTANTSSGRVSLGPIIFDRGLRFAIGSGFGIIVPVFLLTLTLVPAWVN